MKLVELRRTHGLSQAKLAAQLGLSPSTIALYELGRRTPHLKVARKVASFFGVSLDDLEFANGSEEACPNG